MLYTLLCVERVLFSVLSFFFFFFSSRRRHTRCSRDWSSDVCSSDLECDAPMVSICGGEPLIYPKIEELIGGILQQDRIVYVWTNGMFMRQKMRDYMAAHYGPPMEGHLLKLLAEKLITDREAEAIRRADDKA